MIFDVAKWDGVLSVFGHFVGLAHKGLRSRFSEEEIYSKSSCFTVLCVINLLNKLLLIIKLNK